MIFVDTNYFVRGLVDAPPDEDPRHYMQAKNLFRLADRGLLQLTTSDAVLAEVFFVMATPRYGFDRIETANNLKRLLVMPNFRSNSKSIRLDAIDLVADRPSLGFVDAVAAANSIHSSMQLATFDRKLARLPGVIPYQPDSI